jgi:ribonuclease-3
MMDFENKASRLEKIIEYKFNDREILRLALTHSSFANEIKAKNKQMLCNERLEFLGDSILSLVTSEHIFTLYSDLPEGELTKIRADAVCEDALSEYARCISLGEFLFLGHGEELSGGRERKSICADAFEALIAAIYTDTMVRGGSPFEQARKFVLPFVSSHVEKRIKKGSSSDFKTRLQQIVQQVNGEVLEYVVVSESGPDHMKEFVVEAHLNSNVIGTGKGRSKREAEQASAKEALLLFGEQ